MNNFRDYVNDEIKIDICGSLQVDIGFTESSILLYYSSNSKVASKVKDIILTFLLNSHITLTIISPYSLMIFALRS